MIELFSELYTINQIEIKLISFFSFTFILSLFHHAEVCVTFFMSDFFMSDLSDMCQIFQTYVRSFRSEMKIRNEMLFFKSSTF